MWLVGKSPGAVTDGIVIHAKARNRLSGTRLRGYVGVGGVRDMKGSSCGVVGSHGTWGVARQWQELSTLVGECLSLFVCPCAGVKV